MGTLKKHIGALAIDCTMLNIDRDISQVLTVPKFKDTSGREANNINRNVLTQNGIQYCRTRTTYCGLIPFATADELSNYNFKDYAITSIGTASYTTNRTVTDDDNSGVYGAHLVYNVTIQNTGAEAITVGCIRFKGDVPCQISGNYENSVPLLFYSYYLDSPLTIAAGDTESVSIDFYVSN